VILGMEHLTCDLHAFEAEIARATEAELAGDGARAGSAWAAAAALYTAPLLDDEPPAAWIAERAAQVAADAARARRRAGTAATERVEQLSMRLVSGG
jgi:hypothetical protein